MWFVPKWSSIPSFVSSFSGTFTPALLMITSSFGVKDLISSAAFLIDCWEARSISTVLILMSETLVLISLMTVSIFSLDREARIKRAGLWLAIATAMYSPRLAGLTPTSKTMSY